MAARRNRRAENQAFAPQNSEEVTVDLGDLMYRLLAGWKILVLGALIGAIAAGVYSFCLATPKYRAKSTIFVLARRDSAINMVDIQIGAALAKDYIKVFEIWEIHEEVITNLGLDATYTEMLDMLTVRNDEGTRMLEIIIEHSDPKLAAAIANEYAQVVRRFIAETMATDAPNIMSVALEPANPVSPKKMRNVVLGLMAGGGTAAAVVVAWYLMDDKYKTAEDIRKYAGLATLAMIPVNEGPDGPGKARKAGRDA